MAEARWKKITIKEAQDICEKKALCPARVGETDIVQFTKIGSKTNLRKVTWEEFENLLSNKNLAIYEYKGFMKIMGKDGTAKSIK